MTVYVWSKPPFKCILKLDLDRPMQQQHLTRLEYYFLLYISRLHPVTAVTDDGLFQIPSNTCPFNKFKVYTVVRLKSSTLVTAVYMCKKNNDNSISNWSKSGLSDRVVFSLRLKQIIMAIMAECPIVISVWWSFQNCVTV